MRQKLKDLNYFINNGCDSLPITDGTTREKITKITADLTMVYIYILNQVERHLQNAETSDNRKCIHLKYACSISRRDCMLEHKSSINTFGINENVF